MLSRSLGSQLSKYLISYLGLVRKMRKMLCNNFGSIVFRRRLATLHMKEHLVQSQKIAVPKVKMEGHTLESSLSLHVRKVSHDQSLSG